MDSLSAGATPIAYLLLVEAGSSDRTTSLYIAQCPKPHDDAAFPLLDAPHWSRGPLHCLECPHQLPRHRSHLGTGVLCVDIFVHIYEGEVEYRTDPYMHIQSQTPPTVSSRPAASLTRSIPSRRNDPQHRNTTPAALAR